MKFRPQHYNPRGKLKWWRLYGEYVGQLNWQENVSDQTFRKLGWPRVYRIGQHLHYLACHAPKPVNSKWSRVWHRFNHKYRNF